MICQVKFQILNGKYRVNVFERDPSLLIAWSFLFVCLITFPYLSRLLSIECFNAYGLQPIILLVVVRLIEMYWFHYIFTKKKGCGSPANKGVWRNAERSACLS